MGNAHYFKAGNINIVVVQIGQIADAGNIFTGQDVGRLPFRSEYFAMPPLVIPEHLRGRFADRYDTGVVGQGLPGIGFGFVGIQLLAPLLFSSYDFPHNSFSRIFVSHDQCIHFCDRGLKRDFQLSAGLEGNGMAVGMIANIPDQQGGGKQRVGNTHRKAAVFVGDCAAIGPLDGDVRQGKGFPRLSVGDRPFNHFLSKGRGAARRKKQDNAIFSDPLDITDLIGLKTEDE